MAHHAYFYAGDKEEGIAAALAFTERKLGLPLGNPDLVIERHGLFAVDDARRIAGKAGLAALGGGQKAIVIAASRIFHEAQNAMLKLFEEPPEDTTLILILPAEGDLLYTLRSRLQPLPDQSGNGPKLSEEAEAFIAGGLAAREKVVAKILDAAKSDDDDEKQEARSKALRLAEGLAQDAHANWVKNSDADLAAFLKDLDRLIPILHDRSAPLKPILEHILITAPPER